MKGEAFPGLNPRNRFAISGDKAKQAGLRRNILEQNNSSEAPLHSCRMQEGGRRRIKEKKKGQSLIEYAVIVAIVSVAMIAMSTYVFRSVQATQKMVEEEFANK